MMSRLFAAKQWAKRWRRIQDAGSAFALCLALVLMVEAGAKRSAIAIPLEAIQRRGRLIVGVKDNLRPLGYLNSGGELAGFEIDLARRLAADLLGDDQAIQLVPVSNRDRLYALLTDQVDVVIAQLTSTDDRRRVVQFSPTYYFDGLTLITDQPDLIRLADFANQRLGFLEGSVSFDLLRSRFPRAELIPSPSYQAALAGFRQGEIDGFAGDASVLAGWVQEYPAFQQQGPLLSAEPLAIALPKGLQHESLRQAIEQSLNQLKRSGWLEERAQHWELF